jgi:hypothetical protein
MEKRMNWTVVGVFELVASLIYTSMPGRVRAVTLVQMPEVYMYSSHD